MQSKSVRLSEVYSLSTTVEITFILPKLYLKKSIKKQLNFWNSIFCSMWKTELATCARKAKVPGLSPAATYVERWGLASPFPCCPVNWECSWEKTQIEKKKKISFLKVLYKRVLFSIIKVPCKSVLLSIITCRQLLLIYHTQKYFIKSFYIAKTWLCVN